MPALLHTPVYNLLIVKVVSQAKSLALYTSSLLQMQTQLESKHKDT